MKQIKVLRNDKGEPFLQDVVNDWLIEQHLIGRDIDISDIHVPSNGGAIIVLYDESKTEKIDEIIKRYRDRKEMDNYFKSK
jgi:hypothetical protein